MTCHVSAAGPIRLIRPSVSRHRFQGAVVPISALTALQGVRDHGRVQQGQKVLVIGAFGGVGTYAVQTAKAFGAEVTGVCSARRWTWSGSSSPTTSSTQPSESSAHRRKSVTGTVELVAAVTAPQAYEMPVAGHLHVARQPVRAAPVASVGADRAAAGGGSGLTRP
jgi:D-arabinose 1-dehydrogenase-like Zn-dependent alcohol dehydrogenase